METFRTPDDRFARLEDFPWPAQYAEVPDGDGVRLVTFDRPDALNAFDQRLWYATAEALTDAATDDALRCVVLTGNGRAFSAGQDLGEMNDPSVFAGQEPGYQVFMPVLEAFPKPVPAAVNGVGVGIGLTMLLHCDLVLISTDARLKSPFISLGVTTEASAMARVPLAGTDYIPGVSDGKALEEIKTMLDRYLENPVDDLPAPERVTP